VPCHDAFRVAHRGQVDASIPAQQQIEVSRYLFELRAVQRSRRTGRQLEKRREHLGDAERVHKGSFTVQALGFNLNQARGALPLAVLPRVGYFGPLCFSLPALPLAGFAMTLEFVLYSTPP